MSQRVAAGILWFMILSWVTSLNAKVFSPYSCVRETRSSALFLSLFSLCLAYSTVQVEHTAWHVSVFGSLPNHMLSPYKSVSCYCAWNVKLFEDLSWPYLYWKWIRDIYVYISMVMCKTSCQYHECDPLDNMIFIVCWMLLWWPNVNHLNLAW